MLRRSADFHGLKRYQLQDGLDWFFVISDGQKNMMAGKHLGIYPTNPLFGRVWNDKAWSKKILHKSGIKVARGNYFFRDRSYLKFDQNKSLGKAYQYAQGLGYPVFVKPNSGSLGRGAAVVHNETQLKTHLRSLPPHHKIFLIERVIKQPEYRIFVVGGKIMFSYQRKRSFIVGDGSSTVMQLLQVGVEYMDRVFLANTLRKRGWNFNTVLPKDTEIETQARANISTGGHIVNYTEQHSQATKAWVKHITDITGLHVSGIDVFARNGIDDPSGFTVIEVNTRPMLKGIWDLGKQEKVFAIWDEIFKQFFGKHYKEHRKN